MARVLHQHKHGTLETRPFHRSPFAASAFFGLCPTRRWAWGWRWTRWGSGSRRILRRRRRRRWLPRRVLRKPRLLLWRPFLGARALLWSGRLGLPVLFGLFVLRPLRIRSVLLQLRSLQIWRFDIFHAAGDYPTELPISVSATRPGSTCAPATASDAATVV